MHLIFLVSVCCSNAVSAVSPACAVCARGTGRGRWTFYKWDKCRDIVPALWHTDWHSWQMPDIVATMGTLCRFLPDCRGVAWPGLARQACVHTAGQGMLCSSHKLNGAQAVYWMLYKLCTKYTGCVWCTLGNISYALYTTQAVQCMEYKQCTVWREKKLCNVWNTSFALYGTQAVRYVEHKLFTICNTRCELYGIKSVHFLEQKQFNFSNTSCALYGKQAVHYLPLYGT